ncbi:MAG: hypothetical protein MI923_10800 [Phycisphaerales bacterium]|nr:hypothetical protein [Phycisphaerales bacterium]
MRCGIHQQDHGDRTFELRRHGREIDFNPSSVRLDFVQHLYCDDAFSATTVTWPTAYGPCVIWGSVYMQG